MSRLTGNKICTAVLLMTFCASGSAVAFSAESYVEKMSRLEMEFELNKKLQEVQKQRVSIEHSNKTLAAMNEPVSSKEKDAEQARLAALAHQQRVSAIMASIKVLRTYKLDTNAWEALVSVDGGERPFHAGDDLAGVGTIKSVFLGGIEIIMNKGTQRNGTVRLPVMKRLVDAPLGDSSEGGVPGSSVGANAPALVF